MQVLKFCNWILQIDLEKAVIQHLTVAVSMEKQLHMKITATVMVSVGIIKYIFEKLMTLHSQWISQSSKFSFISLSTEIKTCHAQQDYVLVPLVAINKSW